MPNECSSAGNAPPFTSAAYEATASDTAGARSAYLLANLGLILSYMPSRSCRTRTCPSHPAPEPIPIVGTPIVPVTYSAASRATISSTIEKAPASSRLRASPARPPASSAV